jgi:hypothetical protein
MSVAITIHSQKQKRAGNWELVGSAGPGHTVWVDKDKPVNNMSRSLLVPGRLLVSVSDNCFISEIFTFAMRYYMAEVDYVTFNGASLSSLYQAGAHLISL